MNYNLLQKRVIRVTYITFRFNPADYDTLNKSCKEKLIR